MWLVGPLWLAFVYVLGFSILARLPRQQHSFFLAPIVGLMALAVTFAALLIAGKIEWSIGVCALLILCSALGVKRTSTFMQSCEIHWPLFGVMALFSSVQCLMLWASQRPSGDEPNLFWTIYHLTLITPGDSPQGLMQAQYLQYGPSALQGYENFSLFDRPFLGGILTAGAMCAIRSCVGTVFHEGTVSQRIAYSSLWIWTNILSVPTIWLVASTIVRERALPLTVLIAASPFVLFNGIGLWPKFLALYACVLAFLFAIERMHKLALILAAISFFAHGSFLWFFLGLGALITFVEAQKNSSLKRRPPRLRLSRCRFPGLRRKNWLVR